MTDRQIDHAFHAHWRPASGHVSGRWRVCREMFHGQGLETATDRRGRARLFKTEAAAKAVADYLNLVRRAP